jgi:epsilon-lactone hydrolase
MPACVVLLSAGVDFTLSSRSMVTNEGSGPMFDLAELVGMCSFYAPPESYLDPGVSPLFGNFAGLQPLLWLHSVSRIRPAERDRRSPSLGCGS